MYIECLECGHEQPEINGICKCCGEPLPLDTELMDSVDNLFESYESEDDES